jgi:hypothetical protein
LLRAALRLRCLNLSHVYLDAPAALDAVVDAAIACRMQTLSLSACYLLPASAPALARLFTDGEVTELRVWNCCTHMLDEPAALLLADALRANRMLTKLHFLDEDLWQLPAAAAALLGALNGHVSLRELVVGTFPAYQEPDVPLTPVQSVAAGAAFGALVAADAPALETLDVSYCDLGPLADALRHNTHLRALRLHSDDTGDDMYTYTDAFVRERLLPAARANTSLRALALGSVWEDEVRLIMGHRGSVA